MVRKSKRELEHEVNDLAPENDDTAPLIFDLAHIVGAPPHERSDSPHPELTVRPHPESRPELLSLATPNLIPEQLLDQNFVFVESCDREHRHGEPDVLACEWWDALSDEDLEREYQIRQENGDPIPPLLEDYAP